MCMCKSEGIQTYLPSVYPAAMVTLTCGIPCADDKWGNMQKKKKKKKDG